MIGKQKFQYLAILGALLLGTAGATFWGRSMLNNRRITRLESLRADCSDIAARQDWKSLEVAASEWTDLDSTAADAWLNLAEAYEKQGRLAESVESLLKVPERDPKARAAWLYASEMQLGAARQPSRGIETLARLRRLAPRAEVVRKQLISLYAMTLQREKMIAEIRDAMVHHAEPQEAYVYMMIADHLSFTNGFQLNTQWLAAESDSELFAVARAIQLADTLKKLETKSPDTEMQRQVAEDEMAQLSQKYPGNQAMLNYLIESAILDEDVSQVGKLLAQLPEMHRNNSLFSRFQGWHFMMTQQFSKAENAYRQSLAMMPLDWHAWHELASVLRKQARLEEAEFAAQIAVIGKELRKECLALPDASQTNPALLQRLFEYAVSCGADDVAEGLAFRLQ